MNRPTRVIVSLLVTAAATLVAACSSDGGSSPAGTSAAGTAPATAGGDSGASISGAQSAGAQSAATGSPIGVGVVCGCTGPFGGSMSVGGDAIQAWAKTVNGRGGIGGHPVELNFKDDAGDPGKSASVVRDLIKAKVSVIFDLTPLDAAWSKQADAAQIPVVGGQIASPMYYSDPNFFPSGQTQDSVVPATLITAKQAGAKNFAELYCAESPSCAEGVEVRRTAGKELGIPDVYDGSISATAPNYTAQCLAAKQAKAEAIYVGGSATTIVHIANDCSKQGYNPMFVQNGTGFEMIEASAPGLKDSLWASFPVLPFFVEDPALDEFKAAIDKYYPGDRQKDNAFSVLADHAWAGGVLIEHGIKASGVTASDAVDAATVTKGLNSIKDDDLGGLAPSLTFTPGKPHSTKCWYTGRLVDGTPQLTNGGKLTCADQS